MSARVVVVTDRKAIRVEKIIQMYGYTQHVLEDSIPRGSFRVYTLHKDIGYRFEEIEPTKRRREKP